MQEIHWTFKENYQVTCMLCSNIGRITGRSAEHKAPHGVQVLTWESLYVQGNPKWILRMPFLISVIRGKQER